jgi:hypothetical protein
MENGKEGGISYAEMLSKAIVEIVDNNAHLLTILDLQARILAALESRDNDDVVEEVNDLLKARRREALAQVDAWVSRMGGKSG